MYHTGQNASDVEAYDPAGNEWVIKGVYVLRRKTEGAGEIMPP